MSKAKPSRQKKESLNDNNKEAQRTKCIVYSRAMGYIRPVSHWNDGKVSEWKMRQPFKIKASATKK